MCARKKKMIYDSDKWLKPYKDVIDRRHEMILDLKERMSVDGLLSKGMNNHTCTMDFIATRRGTGFSASGRRMPQRSI